MLLLCNGIYLTVLSVHLPDPLHPSQVTAGVEAPHPPGLSLLVTFCTSIPYSPIRRHFLCMSCLVAGAPGHTGQSMPGPHWVAQSSWVWQGLGILDSWDSSRDFRICESELRELPMKKSLGPRQGREVAKAVSIPQSFLEGCSFWLTNISLHQDTWPVLRVSISAQMMFSTNWSYSSHLLTSKDLGSYATHTQGHTLGQGFPTLILVPGLLGTQSYSRSWGAGESPKLYSCSPLFVWTLELHLLSDQQQH